MRLFVNKRSVNQSGEIMLEASIILVIVIIMLFAILSLSFMFYQEAVMTTIASEIASDIGKSYKFTDIAMGDNDIKKSDVTSLKMFRSTFKKNSLEQAQKKRAEEYTDWRVPLASLGFNSDEVELDCEIKSSGLGRNYVYVTISQKTDFFLRGVLEMLQIVDEDTTFSATSYAECVDLMAYTSTVTFVDYATTELDEFNSIGELYISVKGFAEKLFN